MSAPHRLLIVLLASPICLGAAIERRYNVSDALDMYPASSHISSLDEGAGSSLFELEPEFPSRRKLQSSKSQKKHSDYIKFYKELMQRKPRLQKIEISSKVIRKDKSPKARDDSLSRRSSSTPQVVNYPKNSSPAASGTCSLTGRGRCTPVIPLLNWCVPAFNGPILQRKRLEDLAVWDTCAVVGGGKPSKGFGEMIDNCSAVIRTNDAPVKGYEELVGSKTTIRVQNQDYCGALNEKGILNVCRPLSKPFEKKCARRYRSSKCDVDYFSRQFVDFSHKYWVGKKKGVPKISSGFVGIVLSLSICKEVHMFGYSSSPSYYYPKKIVSRYKSRHNWSNEKKCIQYLSKLNHPHIHVHSN